MRLICPCTFLLVEEVQLVRGAAALQFGPQFGGMMNYKLENADTTRSFSIEPEQAAGGYNFFNSFTAVGGIEGELDYYAFYDHRHGDGSRRNAGFSYHSYYAHIAVRADSKTYLAAEFSRMDYVQQIAGGLTDAQFHANARQSVQMG